MRRLPAEWEHSDAVILAWPHADTDWAATLDDVVRCYVDMAEAIQAHSRLIIVAPDTAAPRRALSHIPADRISFADILTNDTWTRDYGPITVDVDGQPVALDFQFNGWGLKFAAYLDNLVTRQLHRRGLLAPTIENHLGFTLEGGSIESDGRGTLLTTSRCLLSPNRNGDLSHEAIENELKRVLGVRKVNWLDHGALEGDDTDSHIDTLARLAPDNRILFVECDWLDDIHFEPLRRMKEQLAAMTDADGLPYALIPLPLPDPIFDGDGNRLPATYANFLVVNDAVIVPTYRQPASDDLALGIISRAFPDHTVKAVDSTPLIIQHGSLHCSTMQIITRT